jgi:hypothetical protein
MLKWDTFSFFYFGGLRWIRTIDRPVMGRELYLLSYEPGNISHYKTFAHESQVNKGVKRMHFESSEGRVDPIKILLLKYPRLLIIKAAFEIFSQHKKIDLFELEINIKKEFERSNCQKRA